MYHRLQKVIDFEKLCFACNLIFWYYCLSMWYFCTIMAQYMKYLVNTVDSDDLVL